MDTRKRNFACILYPDSLVEGWENVLSDLKVPAFLSPLHDKDVNNGDGSPKKPHYHLMVMYEGKKTDEQFYHEVVKRLYKEGCEPSIGAMEYVQSLRGYARYLAHMDNPEKAQYDPNDIKCYAGADFAAVASLVIDKYRIIGEMMDFCDDNHIYSYHQLVCYAREHRFDWFRTLCDCGTFTMKEYLKSAHWESEKLNESHTYNSHVRKNKKSED